MNVYEYLGMSRNVTEKVFSTFSLCVFSVQNKSTKTKSVCAKTESVSAKTEYVCAKMFANFMVFMLLGRI